VCFRYGLERDRYPHCAGNCECELECPVSKCSVINAAAWSPFHLSVPLRIKIVTADRPLPPTPTPTIITVQVARFCVALVSKDNSLSKSKLFICFLLPDICLCVISVHCFPHFVNNGLIFHISLFSCPIL